MTYFYLFTLVKDMNEYAVFFPASDEKKPVK